MEKKTTSKGPAKKSGNPDAEKVQQKTTKKAAAVKDKPVSAKTEKSAPLEQVQKTSPKAVAVETPRPAPADVAVEVPAEAKPAPAKTAEKRPASARRLRLRWVRSAIGAPEKQKRIVRGLGFHRLREIITRPDTPMIRGMVGKIPHLVEIVD